MGRGGGGGTLIFSYIRRLGSFFWGYFFSVSTRICPQAEKSFDVHYHHVQFTSNTILNFKIFGVFRKIIFLGV